MRIFPETSLLTTEFEKIKELISFHCIGALGKKKLKEIQISSDIETINRLLEKTNEFKKLIAASENFPTDNYKDISKELNLLKVENSVLQAEQFINILKIAFTVRDVFRFFETNAIKYPKLFSVLNNLRFEKNIITEIEIVFDEEGVVRSTASAELARIRKALQRSRVDADRIYQTLINKYRKEGWLTDAEQSSRKGRRVISVFAEQKRALKGIVHDVSTTGKTVFLEPQEVIEINNSIFNLEQDERLEIQKILRELTSSLRKYQSLLTHYMDVLSEFDFARAKALYAIAADAHLPHIVNQALVDLKHARHPLLYIYNKENKKQTIPFDLKLKEQRILVISGPNAGGKTVCMKTIGLLQIMLQSGILVTADENSTMGIFEHLLVDIGDSQSLEYELSTYSSRLQNAKVFLERTNERSLFLIDEFGTGTDPNLGGVLAESILVELNKRKSFGIVTTHYLNLKVMADKTPGIINGSMAFDAKHLKPLYHLMVGKPGSSYTFVVAERSGLPQSVIQRAKSKVDNKSLVLEKLLNDVEKEKALLKKKLDEISEKEKKLNEFILRTEQIASEAEQIASEAEQMNDNLDMRIRQKELKLITQSETTIRKFIKEYKLSKNKKHLLLSYQNMFFKRRKELEPRVTDAQIAEEVKQRIESIKVGSLVKLIKGRTTGKVCQITNGKAHVLFGAMKTICDLSQLIPLEAEN
jgi:DNA mismatch repair protein MutS2